MARFASMLSVLILAMSWLMIADLGAGQSTLSPAAECSGELAELLPCLDFLTNASTSLVSPACCSGLTNVSTASPLCLCQFISSNANQSAALGINDTRAFELPAFCNLNANPASCVPLLGPSSAPAPLPLAADTPETTPAASSPGTSVAPEPAKDCTSETASLLPCLDFLSGKDNSPSTDCCTHLGDVVSTEPACLCSLISSSSSSSIIAGINVTLALELPAMCKVPASLDECPGVSLPPGITSEGPRTSAVERSSAATPFMMIVLAGAAIGYIQTAFGHLI